MIQNLTDLYRQRRRTLMERIGDGAILINSAGSSTDSALWDKNLMYLSGISDKSAYLLLVPQGVMVEQLETRGGPELMRGRKVREILFIEAQSPGDTFMNGPAPNHEDLVQQ